MKTRIHFTLILIVLLWLATSGAAMAQTPEYKAIHQGNRAFVAKDYKAAENYYRAALKENPSSSRAHFNLGDAFLAQNDAKTAMQEYETAARTERNKTVRAMAYHNIGYIHHAAKEYDKAIDYYKKALRLNPRDEDTRYNLALCQKQKKDQKDDKKQQQNQQQQNNQQQQQQQNNPDNPKMSNDNAEQLLNLSRQSERQTREKVQRARQPRRKTLEKNW